MSWRMLFISLSMLGVDAFAKHYCISRHAHEAIDLNQERRPHYARESQGASEKISKKLIRSERAILPKAWVLDTIAIRYQAAGIPIFCDELEPLSKAPPFVAREPGPHPLPSDFREVNVETWIDDIKSERERRGWIGAQEKLLDALTLLSGELRLNCMLRHLIESALRIADHAETHLAQAREKKIPGNLEKLILKSFHATLDAFILSHELDQMALPLQLEGIPILCRDVPPVPRSSGL